MRWLALGMAMALIPLGCGSDDDAGGSASGGSGGASGAGATGGTGGGSAGAGGGSAGTGGGAAGAGGGSAGAAGDDCNTTAECKQKYGSGATDCLNSQSDQSVCMCGTSPCTQGGFSGRIAVSADGNFHDRDDIGATPVTLAILAQAKLQAKLVHYDHSSHLAQNDSDQYGDMIASTTGHLSEFGFDQNVVFDDQTQLSAAVANIAKVIDASTASDPLTFIVAGPFEVTYQGVAAASADKLQYVTLLSHSTWNEDHEHVPAEHTKDELLADFPAVKFIKISDQNANAFKSSPSAWDWMNAAGADLTWVRGRMVQAEYAEGDNSDAGMAFYLVTGNEKATMNDIKTFFGQ
ncbi:MAG: hypothetical protein KC776_17720 [Myxococcales bacterium]|nr:hypothetical protein [Myxococcales bacterium]MCB9581564.1 hypothetical protein [Polyangiaceae bacterium]